MRSLCVRLVLAGIWLVAAQGKLLEPVQMAQSISNYRLLPDWLIPLLALSLPWLELVLGASLLLGGLTGGAAALTAGLGVGFAGAMGSALARGLDIECGCFGRGGHVSVGGLILDLSLVGLGALLWNWGPGPWSLDARWAPAQSDSAHKQ